MLPAENKNTGASDAPQTPQTNSKMSHAEPLRDHDFSVPEPSGQSVNAPAHPQPAAPASIAAGGEPGEVDGDTQSSGEGPSIIDQREATPDFAQQR